MACFCGGYLMVALMLATTVLGLLNVALGWSGGADASGGFLKALAPFQGAQYLFHAQFTEARLGGRFKPSHA